MHKLRGVKIGENVFIGDDVYIENEYPELVEIQSNASIALKSVLIAHSFGLGQIVVESEASISAGVLIVASANRKVTIGENSVIAPGAIITKSVPRNTYVAAPASIATYRITNPLNFSSREDFMKGLVPLKRGPKN